MPRVVILCTDPARKTFVESALKGLDAPVVEEYGQLEKELTRKATHMVIVDASQHADIAPFVARTVRKSPKGEHLKILVLAEKAEEDYSSYTLAGVDEVIVPPLKKKTFQETVLRHLRQLSKKKDKTDTETTETNAAPTPPPQLKTDLPPLPKQAPPPKVEPPAAPQPAEKKAVPSETAPPASFVNDLAVHIQKALGSLSDADRQRIGDERLAQILYFWKKIDAFDYYQFLAVSPEEASNTIRRAYFKLSKTYHTDRFALVENKRFYEVSNGIWKRMTEAYQILTNQEKRTKYDALLATGRNPDTMRLIEKQKEEYAKAPGSTLKDPNARKFFKLGLSAYEDGNYSAALMNFKIAEGSQKGNEELAEYIRKCQEKK